VSRGHKIGSVDDPLAVYHRHSGKISRWTDKLVSRYAVVYRRYSGLMTEECRRYHVRRLAANGARATAGGFGRIGAFLDALKRYDRRFSDDPFFNIYALASLCLEGILPVSALVRMRNAPKGSDHVELENLYRNIHRA
jgi:hypothetical protein